VYRLSLALSGHAKTTRFSAINAGPKIARQINVNGAMSAVSRVILLTFFTASATYADVAPAQKAVWTFRPSLAARIGYDDNVFLQDPAAVLPTVSGAVPDRAGSWVGRASVALETTWRLSPAFQFDAGYSPELVRYEAYSSEHHDNHTLNLGVRGHEGSWSYQLKGSVLLVDGSEESPIFGHVGSGPAIGGVPVRSRRDQINSKLGGQLTHTFGESFVRAVTDLCVNDYGTRHHSTATVPGYANYVDRSEWSAGADVGHFASKDFAFLVGVRGGQQNQANLLGVSHNYDNTFARFLVGVEGKPHGDLTLRILAGPDVRHYGDDVAASFDRTRTTRYIEASATWTPTTDDTLTFTGKDYLWLSSGGPCAYQHTAGNLQWKHRFNSDWTLALAADVQVGDSRDYAPGGRNDWIYGGTFTVIRSLGAKTKIDFELLREWSDSTIENTPGREYTRWMATIGVRQLF
jgi:hypothetical protein